MRSSVISAPTWTVWVDCAHQARNKHHQGRHKHPQWLAPNRLSGLGTASPKSSSSTTSKKCRDCCSLSKGSRAKRNARSPQGMFYLPPVSSTTDPNLGIFCWKIKTWQFCYSIKTWHFFCKIEAEVLQARQWHTNFKPGSCMSISCTRLLPQPCNVLFLFLIQIHYLVCIPLTNCQRLVLWKLAPSLNRVKVSVATASMLWGDERFSSCRMTTVVFSQIFSHCCVDSVGWWTGPVLVSLVDHEVQGPLASTMHNTLHDCVDHLLVLWSNHRSLKSSICLLGLSGGSLQKTSNNCVDHLPILCSNHHSLFLVAWRLCSWIMIQKSCIFCEEGRDFCLYKSVCALGWYGMMLSGMNCWIRYFVV